MSTIRFQRHTQSHNGCQRSRDQAKLKYIYHCRERYLKNVGDRLTQQQLIKIQVLSITQMPGDMLGTPCVDECQSPTFADDVFGIPGAEYNAVSPTGPSPPPDYYGAIGAAQPQLIATPEAMALALAMVRSKSIETMPNTSNSESTEGLGLGTPARADVAMVIDAETIPEPPKKRHRGEPQDEGWAERMARVEGQMVSLQSMLMTLTETVTCSQDTILEYIKTTTEILQREIRRRPQGKQMTPGVIAALATLASEAQAAMQDN